MQSRQQAVAPPDPNAYFSVSIDGDDILELAVSQAGDYSAGYAPVSLDVSPYADGNNHTLTIRLRTSRADVYIDDVRIVDNLVFASGFDSPPAP